MTPGNALESERSFNSVSFNIPPYGWPAHPTGDRLWLAKFILAPCNFCGGPSVLASECGLMTKAEYNECVDTYADGVFRFIRKQMRNEHSAQDVVQNSFEILWKHRTDVDFEKAKAYLFKVAYHNMIDQIRKRKKEIITDELPETQMSMNNHYSGLKEVLDEALGKLPEIQKASVTLRDYEGYSYEEIGKILDLSDAQVKVYIFRARKALRKYLLSPHKIV